MKKKHKLVYCDLYLPAKLGGVEGYHTMCYKRFTALLKKYREVPVTKYTEDTEQQVQALRYLIETALCFFMFLFSWFSGHPMSQCIDDVTVTKQNQNSRNTMKRMYSDDSRGRYFKVKDSIFFDKDDGDDDDSEDDEKWDTTDDES